MMGNENKLITPKYYGLSDNVLEVWGSGKHLFFPWLHGQKVHHRTLFYFFEGIVYWLWHKPDVN